MANQFADWNKFRVKNEKYTDAFETLCFHIFCRTFKVTDLTKNHNNPGIETDPVLVNDQYVGFQSKFFEGNISYSDIKDSIAKASKYYPEINKIIIYLNKDGTEDRKKGIIDYALSLKINVEFKTNPFFEEILSQIAYVDLYQFYFTDADIVNFIKSNITIEAYTALQAKSFINLQLEDTTKKQIKCFSLYKVIKNCKNLVLITGSPGSGKSMVINKLFQISSGFNKLTSKHKNLLNSPNNPIPMIIRLKDCYSDSLENLIRNRQADYDMRNQKNIKFIYLLDGLDELTEEKAIQCINYIKQFGNIANTSSIIVSCRISSINKIHFYSHLENIQEYTISKLTESEIQFYFKNHVGGIKASSLEQVNNSLVSEITDILLLTLLWEHIENLDLSNSAMELFKLKIDSFQKNKKLIQGLEILNLPTPKWEHIISLNQQISYEFHNKFQFRLPHERLYQLISDLYPKADYHSVNNILYFLAHSFFDNASEASNKSYIYQHRIYQEYFFAQKLQSEYENNPQILRGLNIFSNYEFFNNFFLPYLRNNYEIDKNLIGLLELNLIDVYLGKNKSWGADEPYFNILPSFMEALSLQKDITFNQLWTSEGWNIQNIINIDVNLIKTKLKQFQQEPSNFSLNRELENIYENRLGLLLVLSQFLHSNNKLSESQLIIDNFSSIYTIYETFLQTFKDANHGRKLNDPLADKYESYIYYLLVINRSDLLKILNDEIKPTVNNSLTEEQNNTLLAYFYEPCFKHRLEEFIDIVDQLNDLEFIGLLEFISQTEYLNILTNKLKLKDKIYTRVNMLPVNDTQPNVTILFIRKLLGLELTTKCVEYINGRVDNIRRLKHYGEWQIRNEAMNYIKLFYISDVNYDEDLTWIDIIGHLFMDYVNSLNDNISLLAILRNHITLVSKITTQEKSPQITRIYISTIWAAIISFSKEQASVKQNIKNILFSRHAIEIDPWELCMNIYQFDKETFKNIINAKDLSFFELSNENQPGKINIPKGGLISIYEEIDQLFNLSKLFAHCNPDKSMKYFLQAMNNSILRHGSRKDHIVCSDLVEALDIVWRNYLYPQDKLHAYTKGIYNLIKKIVNLTERTSYGPGNLISTIARHDLTLANELYDDLSKIFTSGYYLTAAFIGIQKTKIDLGADISEIWEENYPLDNQHSEVFTHILKSEFYTNLEKEPVFNQFHTYVEELQTGDNSALKELLEDQEFTTRYASLCKNFNKPFNLVLDNQGEDPYKSSPKEIIDLPERLDTKEQLDEIYKNLSNYAILSKQDDWQRLIDKTFDMDNNIKRMTTLFKEMRYPHGVYFAGSSGKYYYYAIAYTLQKTETSTEMFEYLSKNSGHEGLLELMKAYEVNQDFKQCMKIFERFLGLCHLLVDTN